MDRFMGKIFKLLVLYMYMGMIFTTVEESGNKYLMMFMVEILCTSSVTFFMYGIDKWKAEHNKWRIREKTLLTWGFFGGACGAITGMIFFNHKTRKGYFWTVNIVSLIATLIIVIYFKNS